MSQPETIPDQLLSQDHQSHPSDETIAGGSPASIRSSDSTILDEFQIRPRLIAILGIEGSGKTRILNHLRRTLGEAHLLFFDAADLIESRFGGRRAVFAMNTRQLAQLHWDVTALVQRECTARGKVGVVAGDVSLWDERVGKAKTVMTFGDVDAFDLCLYVRYEGHAVAAFRDNDRGKLRARFDAETLDVWQRSDVAFIKKRCLDYGIFNQVVTPDSLCFEGVADTFVKLVEDFRVHDKQENMRRFLAAVDDAMASAPEGCGAVVVIDGDAALSGADTQLRWWRESMAAAGVRGRLTPYEELMACEVWGFEQRHSYDTLRQLVYMVESRPRAQYPHLCCLAGMEMTTRVELLRLLYRLKNNETPVLLVTSGLKDVWVQMLRLPEIRLSDHVRVIGGGRISDGFVVTALARAAMVKRLREDHGLRVIAFGMQEEDVPMLEAAEPDGILVAQWRVSDEVEEAVRRAEINPARLILRNPFDGGSMFNGEVLTGAVAEPGEADLESVGDIFEKLNLE